MEIICKRFHFVGQLVLSKLDDQSLAESKKTSREISEFLEVKRFFWIRIIKKYKNNFKGFEESWNEVLVKTPFDVIKQLAVTVVEFSNSYPTEYTKVSPLHIAAIKGSVVTVAEFHSEAGEFQ